MLYYMMIKNKNIENDTRNLKEIFESIIRINFKKESNNLVSINLFSPENLEFIFLLTTSILRGGKKKKRKSKKKLKKKKTKKRKRKKGGNGHTRRRRTPRNISPRSSSKITTARSNDIFGFVQKLLVKCFIGFIFYNLMNNFAPTYRPVLNTSTNIVPSLNWTTGIINPDLFPVLNPNINITFERLTQTQIKKLIISKNGNITNIPLRLVGLGETLYAEIDLVSKTNSPTDVALKEFNKLPFRERSSLHSPINSGANGYTSILKWNFDGNKYDIIQIPYNRDIDRTRRFIQFPEQNSYNRLLKKLAEEHLDVMKKTNILEEDETSGIIQINFNDIPTNVLSQIFQVEEEQYFHRDGTRLVNSKLNLTNDAGYLDGFGIRQTNYLRNQTKFLRPDRFSYPLSITYTPETEYTANVRIHSVEGESKQIRDKSQTIITEPGTSHTHVLAQHMGSEHGSVFLPQGRPLKNPRRFLFIGVFSDKYYSLNEVSE